MAEDSKSLGPVASIATKTLISTNPSLQNTLQQSSNTVPLSNIDFSQISDQELGSNLPALDELKKEISENEGNEQESQSSNATVTSSVAIANAHVTPGYRFILPRPQAPGNQQLFQHQQPQQQQNVTTFSLVPGPSTLQVPSTLPVLSTTIINQQLQEALSTTMPLETGMDPKPESTLSLESESISKQGESSTNPDSGGPKRPTMSALVNKNISFVCYDCQKDFIHPKGLYQHLLTNKCFTRMSEGKKIITCVKEGCSKEFEDKKELWTHLKFYHILEFGDDKRERDQCKRESSNKRTFSFMEEAGVPLKCYDCQKTFTKSKKMYDHYTATKCFTRIYGDGTTVISCFYPNCGIKFQTKIELWRHARDVHILENKDGPEGVSSDQNMDAFSTANIKEEVLDPSEAVKEGGEVQTKKRKMSDSNINDSKNETNSADADRRHGEGDEEWDSKPKLKKKKKKYPPKKSTDTAKKIHYRSRVYTCIGCFETYETRVAYYDHVKGWDCWAKKSVDDSDEQLWCSLCLKNVTSSLLNLTGHDCTANPGKEGPKKIK